MNIRDVKETKELRSDSGGGNLDNQINSLLGHGWVLLHVGQETQHDSDGKPYQNTVALLGRIIER